MSEKQHTFVHVLPPGRSLRDKELEQAKARSHAAKVVHGRWKDAERGCEQSVDAQLRKHGFITQRRERTAPRPVPRYTSLRQERITYNSAISTHPDISQGQDYTSDACPSQFNKTLATIKSRKSSSTDASLPVQTKEELLREETHFSISNHKRQQREVQTVKNIQTQQTTPLNSAASSLKYDLKSAQKANTWQEKGEDNHVVVVTTLSMILWKGNSDPFCMAAITIDASANGVLTFGRECFMPALYNRETKRESLTAFQTHNDIIDPGAATALMSYYATALAVVSKSAEYRVLALNYQTQTTRRLRQRVVVADRREYPSIIAQVLRLLCCEILNRNLCAAKVHAELLRRLFELSAEDGTLDVLTLCFTLYHDLDLSAIFMVQSTFDTHAWIPKILSQFWTDALGPYLVACPQIQFDISILNLGSLTDMLRDTQNHLYLITAKNVQPYPPEVSFWLVNWGGVLQSRLINHYLGIIERRPYLGLWEDAYITLATLYLEHSLRPRPTIQDVVLFESLSTTMVHLRNAIERSEQTKTPPRSWSALLWALYIGAQAERFHLGPARSVWFSHRFRVCALDMGLRTWEELEQILEHFPYSAKIKPYGTDGIEELLE